MRLKQSPRSILIRVQSIAMHTAVERALAEVWPDRERAFAALIEVRCLEPEFPPTQHDLAVEAAHEAAELRTLLLPDPETCGQWAVPQQ